MIEIKDLTLSFGGEPVVRDFNLTINDGEIVGIVGESGSGKSVTALTVMGLEAETEKILSGSISYNGVVLREAGKPKDVKLIREYQGDDMSMIFQEPMTSLNPVMKAGKQADEVLTLHTKFEKEDRKKLILDTFREVGLTDAERVYDSYPHELSGGMRQRVMIAMAVLLKPGLIVADEPTTALDVTVQKQIIELLRRIRETYHNSMIFITHDLHLARQLCDRLVVMKDGRIVETGDTEEIFTNPQAEYTKSFIEAAKVGGRKPMREGLDTVDSILEVKDLSVYYKDSGNTLFKATKHAAVKGVSFEIKRGECMGLVGESGCGKTTLAKAILGVNKDTTGTVKLNTNGPQLIFQDPYSSLNPSKTIGWQLEEPLRAIGRMDETRKCSKEERRARAELILEKVGLPKEYYSRKPNELSGGQRQRVSIAQALIAEPEFIIADEPVSALDVTIQAQVMELLRSLIKELDISMLFISHDINVVGAISDHILVMKSGEAVEVGEASQVLDSPHHEYTRELMRSAGLV